jgi:pimeloyl-ACP methyl ester carboxylesterase
MRTLINIGFFCLLLVGINCNLKANDLPPMQGQRYDIGGYKLHIHCLGQGSPTIIIDAGLGDDSSDWERVLTQSSKISKTCVYDRPGYGWSDVGPKPRSSHRIALELNLLLKQANIPPPYLLVGHSFGGFNMRLFAAHHPQDVIGLILIDASHENQYERLGINLPPPSKRQRNVFVKTPLEHIKANDPKPYALRDRAFRSASLEIAALSLSSEQVRSEGLIPIIPLMVISRGLAEWKNTPNAEQREKTWLILQQELARLSPFSQHQFANSSGHNIPHEQPEIILDAINNITELARAMSSP